LIYIITSRCRQNNFSQYFMMIFNHEFININFLSNNRTFILYFIDRSELFLEDHKLEVDNNLIQNSVAPSKLTYGLPVLEEMMGLQLYTNYHLPNITEIIKSPMVIFNGPLRLNIFLLKSDVKVNKYVMEYKWLTSKVCVSMSCYRTR